jgi:hypothetical protein
MSTQGNPSRIMRELRELGASDDLCRRVAAFLHFAHLSSMDVPENPHKRRALALHRSDIDYPCHRPLAQAPLLSYRYDGRYGWIMIGATDDDDALVQASRSTHEEIVASRLQRWNGSEYVPCEVMP